MRLLVLASILLFGSAAFAGSFGAIAYSPSTGSSGSSWSYGCADEAQKAAIGYCGQADCTPAVWVKSGCAALAVGSDQSRYSWAWSGDQGTADYRALAECMASDAGCRVVASLCSF